MINIVLFGPPGSGKGTQAEKLVEAFNLLHISTGDLFRYNLKNDTELGKEARKYMDAGELVPDEVTIKMLADKVKANPDVQGYIFDGFPRTVNQAEALDDLLCKMDTSVSGLIMLDVDDEEIVKRLLKRGETSGRADDQDESIIRNRIDEYNQKTAPVFDHYHQVDKAFKVAGVGSIDEIFERLENQVNAFA